MIYYSGKFDFVVDVLTFVAHKSLAILIQTTDYRRKGSTYITSETESINKENLILSLFSHEGSISCPIDTSGSVICKIVLVTDVDFWGVF